MGAILILNIMGQVVIETDRAFVLIYFVERRIHTIITSVVGMLVLSIVLRQVSTAYSGDGTRHRRAFLLFSP